MQLSAQDIREVLARAEEIHHRDGGGLRAEMQAVLDAAEEAGLPREAVQEALQERLGTPRSEVSAGELVFAQSADGKMHVAEVLGMDQAHIQVKFLEGGEHSVRPSQVRPAKFLPGEKVVCPWPGWGFWTCIVLSYDSAARTIKVTDGWGEYETFEIKTVHVNPPKAPKLGRSKEMGSRLLWWTYAAGAATGGAIGAILTWLLSR